LISEPHPIPIVNAANAPFFDGLRNEEVVLQYCSRCDQFMHPGTVVCPSCLVPELQWVPTSGQGELYSFGIFHRSFHPAFDGLVPYHVAVVELIEGPRLVSQLIDVGLNELYVGMPVQADFKKTSGTVPLLWFRSDITG
jgi:uncharacterized OB-fold protein